MTAHELWRAIKWSNQNPDGSVTIPKDRVDLIDEIIDMELICIRKGEVNERTND